MLKKCTKRKIYFTNDIEKDIGFKSPNNPNNYIRYKNRLFKLFDNDQLDSNDEYIIYSNVGYTEDYLFEYINNNEVEFKKIEIISIINTDLNNIIKLDDINYNDLIGKIINDNTIIINDLKYVFNENYISGYISNNTKILLSDKIQLSCIARNNIYINNSIIIIDIDLTTDLATHSKSYVNIKNFNTILGEYLDTHIINPFNDFNIQVENIMVKIKCKLIEHKLFNYNTKDVYYNVKTSKIVIDNILSNKLIFYTNVYYINNSSYSLTFNIDSSTKSILEYNVINDILKSKLEYINYFYTDTIIDIHHINPLTNEYIKISFTLDNISTEGSLINSDNKNINKFILDYSKSESLKCNIVINKSNSKGHYLIHNTTRYDLQKIKLQIIKKHDKTSNDKTTNDKTPNDKTTNDKTTNDKTSNDKTTNDKTTNDKTTNDKTTNDKKYTDILISDILTNFKNYALTDCLMTGDSYESSEYNYKIIDLEYVMKLDKKNIYLSNITDSTIIEFDETTIQSFNIIDKNVSTNKQSCINLNIENIKNFSNEISKNHMGGMKSYIDKIIREVLISRTNILNKTISKHMKKSNGIILYGPPGTGKTTFAKNIGKILSLEPDNIQMLTSTELLNKYLGQSEYNIRELFNKAHSDYVTYGDDSPLHLFIIDEIDAILGCRNSGIESNIKDSIVNQFLGLLDGLNTTNNFIIIGITNLLSKIDKAALRVGRFGCHIYIGLPDIEQRKEIINLNIQKFNSDNSVFEKFEESDIEHLVKMTDNMSGADIENIFIQALNKYIYNKLDDMSYDKKISIIDFDEIIFGMHSRMHS